MHGRLLLLEVWGGEKSTLHDVLHEPVQILSLFCSFLFTVLKELNRLFKTVFPLIGTLKSVKKVTHKRCYLTSKSNKVVNENT